MERLAKDRSDQIRRLFLNENNMVMYLANGLHYLMNMMDLGGWGRESAFTSCIAMRSEFHHQALFEFSQLCGRESLSFFNLVVSTKLKM